MMKHLLLSLCGLLLCLQLAWAQAPATTEAAAPEVPAFIADSLDDYIRLWMVEEDIPGMAVVIVHQNKMIYRQGFGVTEQGGSQAVDENTLFAIGSNTKAFTGIALASLHAQGKLSLDDRVTQWLPDFKLHDPHATALANLRDLLSHRMGFATFQGDFTYWNSDLSQQQVVATMGRIEPQHDFRTTWGYTNAGYTTAALVMEKASGQSWAATMQALFDSLNMDETRIGGVAAAESGNAARGHAKLGTNSLQVVPYPQMNALAPAGDIYSSAHDMTHWVITLLRKGVWARKQVIPQEALTQAWTPASIKGRGNRNLWPMNFQLYGLGWELGDYAGEEIIHHTGGVDGFLSSVLLLPSSQSAIVILTNSLDNVFFLTLRYRILDALMGREPLDYQGLIYPFTAAQNKQEQAQAAALADTVALNNPLPEGMSLKKLAGTYRSTVYGQVSLERDGNSLVATFEHHPGMTATLHHLSDGRFRAVYGGTMFGTLVWNFSLAGGQPQFVLRAHPFVEATPYTFTKE